MMTEAERGSLFGYRDVSGSHVDPPPDAESTDESEYMNRQVERLAAASYPGISRVANQHGHGRKQSVREERADNNAADYVSSIQQLQAQVIDVIC
jgi:hypothetical protein